GRTVRLVRRCVDVDLDRPGDGAAALGGQQDRPPVGDRPLDAAPVVVGRGAIQRREEADRGAVLDRVDQDLAQPAAEAAREGRLDRPDAHRSTTTRYSAGSSPTSNRVGRSIRAATQSPGPTSKLLAPTVNRNRPASPTTCCARAAAGGVG